MLAHTFPQAPRQVGTHTRTHACPPFWARADLWGPGHASAPSHLAVTWVTTPLLFCPPLVPGDSHVTSHTCRLPHPRCLPHTSPLTAVAPSPGRKRAHAQLPRPKMPAEPGVERQRGPDRRLWGPWSPRYLPETKPSLRSVCRSRVLETLETAPLYHCQPWGQRGGRGPLPIPPKRAVVPSGLLRPRYHCTPPPIPGPCSLLPLPRHLGVLGIFRPQLTGCEIAPFAPPQRGGGWRGRNGVGGHTANASGSSGAGRCQAGVRGASHEPEHPSVVPAGGRGDRVGWRRPCSGDRGAQALGDILSTGGGTGTPSESGLQPLPAPRTRSRR